MQGIADQRFTPLLERGMAVSAKEVGGSAAHVATAPASSARKTLRAVNRVLDSVGGLGWSVIGFAAGAIFWHFVGFWGFVSEVVFAGGPPVERAAVIRGVTSAAPAKRVQVVAAAIGAAVGTPCTAVSRDRQTGLTSARPCDRDNPPLPEDSYQGRQDRIDTSGSEGWLPLKTVGAPGH